MVCQHLPVPANTLAATKKCILRRKNVAAPPATAPQQRVLL
jgi:hypothetical protein